MPFCIPANINKKLQKAINDGSINLDNFLTKSQDEIDTILKEHVGEGYSTEIADRFVRKFNTQLNKDQVIDIVKKFREIDSLQAKEGFDTTGKITKDWALKRALLDAQMEDIVNPENKLNILQTIKKGFTAEVKKIKSQSGIVNKTTTGLLDLGKIALSGTWKSIKASIDASFALRQGFKVFIRDPKVWWNQVKNSFDILGKVTSPEIRAEMMLQQRARMLSQKNYSRLINDGKLAVDVLEDWFPTTMAEKVPVLGKMIKSSSEAFTSFIQGSRFELANDLLNNLESRLGRQATKEEIKGLGQLINSLTSRGSLGKLESVSGFLNKLLWSGRYIRSQVDTFLMPFNKQLTPEIQKEALKESVKVFSAIGALMGTMSMFTEVEWNPISTNFGKAKIGNSWVDLTSGLGSYIRLATQTAIGEKIGAGGKYIKFGEGYKPTTRASNIGQFARGKLAPAPSTILDILSGKNAVGKEVTPTSAAINLTAPISPSNMYDFFTNEELSTAFILSLFDTLGAGVTNRY